MAQGHYVAIEASEVLPGLGLDLLTSFIERTTTLDAIRDYFQAMRDYKT